MTDNSDLRLSEFYFAVIQILRIVPEWIQESMDDLQEMAGDMKRLYLSSNAAEANFATFVPQEGEPQAKRVTIEAFMDDWESVISLQQRMGKTLLARITKLHGEVKSLRDGVSARLNSKFDPL